jgi:hypothetical protein
MTSAEVTPRGCSMPLQRAITDFGADHAFADVPKKMREHYGTGIPVSTARNITEFHAEQIHKQKAAETIPTTVGCLQQIAEIDGCMLPIVTVSEGDGDKRKQKKLHWQEARLALVHEQGSTTPKFDATFQGSVDNAGQALLNCAVASGLGTQTQIHGVGDGALWIANQIEDKFGTQASYLVDFYHICEYLADAAKTCAPNDNKAWMDIQKGLLKNNEYAVVIENLVPYLEADEIEEAQAKVRACHRYLSNRVGQLDYKGAIEKGLPIGSGEIESAHRYVIQKRLKLSGAWWKAANVEPMLALRVVRANDDWDEYWEKLAKAA